jgi:Histidine kinase-like ATPase domain
MTVTCTDAPEAPPRQGPARGPSASVGIWPLAYRPEVAGEARKITKELLTQWSVAEDAADSVLLTVSELVTNAVEHARPTELRTEPRPGHPASTAADEAHSDRSGRAEGDESAGPRHSGADQV